MSPRGDWRMPSDATATAWLADLDWVRRSDASDTRRAPTTNRRTHASYTRTPLTAEGPARVPSPGPPPGRRADQRPGGRDDLLLGAAPSTAAPVAVSRSVSAIELDTDLTLLIARCEGCVITLLSYDGVNPVYSSVPATVTGGSVTINLPSARTAGMSVRVERGSPRRWPSTQRRVALRGEAIARRDAASASRRRGRTRRASGCWAGTVNEAVTLTLKGARRLLSRTARRDRLGTGHGELRDAHGAGAGRGAGQRRRAGLQPLPLAPDSRRVTLDGRALAGRWRAP